MCCGGKCDSVVKEEFGYESDDIDDKWISAVEYSWLRMFMHSVGSVCDLLDNTCLSFMIISCPIQTNEYVPCCYKDMTDSV